MEREFCSSFKSVEMLIGNVHWNVEYKKLPQIIPENFNVFRLKKAKAVKISV